LFALPCGCGALGVEIVKKSHFGSLLAYICCILIAPLFAFCLGMAFNAIAIPLAILIGGPIIAWYLIRQRNEVHREAERNLEMLQHGSRKELDY